MTASFGRRHSHRAFLAQSKEVSDQAKMLQVQSDQLAEQRKINALQAVDLEESLKGRARLRRITEREQADMIGLAPSSTWREVPGLDPSADGRAWMIDVTNGSRRLIRNVASRIMAVPDTPGRTRPSQTCTPSSRSRAPER